VLKINPTSLESQGRGGPRRPTEPQGRDHTRISLKTALKIGKEKTMGKVNRKKYLAVPSGRDDFNQLGIQKKTLKNWKMPRQ